MAEMETNIKDQIENFGPINGGCMVDHTKLQQWHEAKAKLDHFKKLETKLRLEICTEMFEGRTGKFTCSEEIEVGDNSFAVVAKSVTNLSVDEAMLHQLYQDGFLSDDDNLCFERKLKIIDSKLRGITSKSNVWKAITEKPGKPKLEVKAL